MPNEQKVLNMCSIHFDLAERVSKVEYSSALFSVGKYFATKTEGDPPVSRFPVTCINGAIRDYGDILLVTDCQEEKELGRVFSTLLSNHYRDEVRRLHSQIEDTIIRKDRAMIELLKNVRGDKCGIK